MAKITDLDVLLPDDLVFRRGDAEYLVPGDLPVETILELFSLYAEISASGAAAQIDRDQTLAVKIVRILEDLPAGKSKTVRAQFVREQLAQLLDERTAASETQAADAEMREINEKVGVALLSVLQLRQPGLDELPFGATGRRIVMQQILANLGVIKLEPGEGDEGEDGNP